MRLYGIYNLHFSFTKKDVEQILNEIPGYSDQEKERVDKLKHRFGYALVFHNVPLLISYFSRRRPGIIL